METLEQLDIHDPEQEIVIMSALICIYDIPCIYIYIIVELRWEDLDFEAVWRFLDIYRRQSGHWLRQDVELESAEA